jgi:hypothetical protein
MFLSCLSRMSCHKAIEREEGGSFGWTPNALFLFARFAVGWPRGR